MLKLVVLFLALGGFAHAQDAQVFYMGNLGFHYTQLFGPFNGDFSVEGAIDTTQWIPVLDEGLGGVIAATDSTGNEQLLAIGARRNVGADTTYHAFGIFYRAEGQIQAGAVANPTSTVQLFLLWNLDSLALPTELPDSLNLEDILGAISAEHKFVGVATSMNITLRNETTLDFSFSGIATDLNNTTTIITLSNGASHMVGNMVSAVDEPSTRPGAEITLAPNPFNPGTELRFTLPAPGEVTLQVHDLRGRLLDQRSLGWEPAGEHRVTWNGADQASGLVFLTLVVDGRSLGTSQGLLLK